MAKLTKSNLKEHFKNEGLSEGFIEKFFQNLVRQKKEKELEKLTQDPEYQRILKKYNIKPVDWTSAGDKYLKGK
jgi:hypothetical protein